MCETDMLVRALTDICKGRTGDIQYIDVFHIQRICLRLRDCQFKKNYRY